MVDTWLGVSDDEFDTRLRMTDVPHSLPEDLVNMPVLVAVDLDHASQSVRENLVAPSNIRAIVSTFDTSHLEMSALNAAAFQNMPSV